MTKGPIYKIKHGEDLAIDPKYRGQHLGQQALSKVLAELKDAHKIWLVVHPDNFGEKLYQSLNS